MSRVLRLVGSLLLVLTLTVITSSNVALAKKDHQVVLKVRPGESGKVRVKVTDDPNALVQEIELVASSAALSSPASTRGFAQSLAALADGSYNCGGIVTAYGAFDRKLWSWQSSQNYRIVQGNLYIDTHTGTATVYYIGWRYDHATYSKSQSSPSSSASITSIGYFSQGSPGGIGTSYYRGRVQYFIQASTGCQVGGDILDGW